MLEPNAQSRAFLFDFFLKKFWGNENFHPEWGGVILALVPIMTPLLPHPEQVTSACFIQRSLLEANQAAQQNRTCLHACFKNTLIALAVPNTFWASSSTEARCCFTYIVQSSELISYMRAVFPRPESFYHDICLGHSCFLRMLNAVFSASVESNICSRGTR